MNKTKVDIAEDVVFRWFSITRNLSIERPSVIRCLRVGIALALLKSGYHQEQAQIKTQEIIQSWANECDGLEANHPSAIQVLEKKIELAL